MAVVAAFLNLWSRHGLRPAPPTPVTAPVSVSGAQHAARPWAARSAAAASSGESREAGARPGFSAVGLGVLSAAAWRTARGRRKAGLVVVRGRNYETNIKKKKGPAEAKKAKITGKHLRNIIVAVRESGADEATNPRLTRLIKQALKDNVPRSTIDNRIKKFVEEPDNMEEILMGGYGLGGSAVLVEALTTNTNRTRSAVKQCFKAINTQVGNDGCVDHVFNKQGVIIFKGVDEETVVEAGLEADAEDCVTKEDGSVEVLVAPENFHAAQEVFEGLKLEPASADVMYLPTTEATLSEEHSYEMKRLIALLEEEDDAGEVHHNCIFAENTPELMTNAYGQYMAYDKVVKAKK